MKDYYNILGVTPTASQADIKKVYRQLAIQYHPDKNNGAPASEERFKEISEAYIIIGDAAKRNAYDFTKGHHKNYYGQNPASGEATPATYLILLKSIKNKVFNAGGYINQEALFKVIDDVLSNETIQFLVSTGQVNTNNMIIDEVLVCGVFL
ncbi:MAG: DnaJ domain-containing protein, partial [Bacteroidota bacterium]